MLYTYKSSVAIVGPDRRHGSRRASVPSFAPPWVAAKTEGSEKNNEF